jgi:hypothetical protein
VAAAADAADQKRQGGNMRDAHVAEALHGGQAPRAISKLKSPEILEDALTLESGGGLSYPYRSTKKNKRLSV